MNLFEKRFALIYFHLLAGIKRIKIRMRKILTIVGNEFMVSEPISAFLVKVTEFGIFSVRRIFIGNFGLSDTKGLNS